MVGCSSRVSGAFLVVVVCVIAIFSDCTLVGKGYSYSEASTVNKMHISNFKLSTPALMVDILYKMFMSVH